MSSNALGNTILFAFMILVEGCTVSRGGFDT